MITCDSLTVEKVKKELTEVEATFKAERKALRALVKATSRYGWAAEDHSKAITKLNELEVQHKRWSAGLGRKLRALLAVLEAEADAKAIPMKGDGNGNQTV